MINTNIDQYVTHWKANALLKTAEGKQENEKILVTLIADTFSYTDQTLYKFFKAVDIRESQAEERAKFFLDSRKCSVETFFQEQKRRDAEQNINFALSSAGQNVNFAFSLAGERQLLKRTVNVKQKGIVSNSVIAPIPAKEVGSTQQVESQSVQDPFMDLHQRIGNCVSFVDHKPNKPVGRDIKSIKQALDFENFSRRVQKGKSSTDETLIFIKSPNKYGREQAAQKANLRNEELAFRISNALLLHVVPPTKIAKIKDVKKNQADDDQCVVQSAVRISPTQFHLQSEIPQEELKKLNITDVHKAILFNMVTGRFDGRKANTVIDENMGLMEIDNEMVGFPRTDSWILQLKDLEGTPLDKNLVKSFAQLDKQSIMDVFAHMAHQELTIEKEKETNILKNFDKIQKFFAENQDKEIRVADLIAINASK